MGKKGAINPPHVVMAPAAEESTGDPDATTRQHLTRLADLEKQIVDQELVAAELAALDPRRVEARRLCCGIVVAHAHTGLAVTVERLLWRAAYYRPFDTYRKSIRDIEKNVNW